MVGTVALFIAVIILAWLFRDVLKKMRAEIIALKRENLHCAQGIIADRKRLEAAEEDARKTLEIVVDLQKSTAPEPIKTKVATKPARTNWRSFRSAAEKASDPQEQE